MRMYLRVLQNIVDSPPEYDRNTREKHELPTLH